MQYRKDVKRNRRIFFNYVLSMPFIYGMAVPLVCVDICFEVYHRICFFLCGLPYVKRSKYIRIDRHKLSYLAWFEKINCAYCGYANGLVGYVSAILAETEKYWCGIMHAKYEDFIPPKHHKNFLPYGNEKALEKFVQKEE